MGVLHFFRNFQILMIFQHFPNFEKSPKFDWELPSESRRVFEVRIFVFQKSEKSGNFEKKMLNLHLLNPHLRTPDDTLD